MAGGVGADGELQLAAAFEGDFAAVTHGAIARATRSGEQAAGSADTAGTCGPFARSPEGNAEHGTAIHRHVSGMKVVNLLLPALLRRTGRALRPKAQDHLGFQSWYFIFIHFPDQ